MPTPPTTVQEISTPGYLFPAFRPVELVLHSPELIDAEYASLALDCTTVTDSTVFTVNGYTFTAANKLYEDLDYGEFQSLTPIDSFCSRTLQLAMLASPLADDYYITEIGQDTGTVTLSAKKDGPAYNLAFTLVSGAIGSLVQDANPTTPSQYVALKNWGVYVNPYVNVTERSYTESGTINNDYGLTALPRLELPYNPANRYVFDLAAYIQAYLKPDVTDEFGTWQPSRMIGAGARYGGIFGSAASAYRKEVEDYRWPPGGYSTGTYIGGGLAWGIASTGFLPDGSGCFVHDKPTLARPLYMYYDEDYASNVYRPHCSIFMNAGADFVYRLRYMKTNGLFFNLDGSYSIGAGRGGIHDINTYTITDDDAAPFGVQEVTVQSFDPGDGTTVINELRFVNVAEPTDLWLAFVSTAGGLERWNFVPDVDLGGKRTLTTYIPADGTLRMQGVDLVPTQRLYSRQLDKAQFDFLSVELQASPSVFLIDLHYGNKRVVVSDFDLKVDLETNTYSLSLEITPSAPTRTVNN